MLGIGSLLAGLGTIFSCYCADQSRTCIYGLIVYLNAPVAAAFRMGEEGYSGDESPVPLLRRDRQSLFQQ